MPEQETMKRFNDYTDAELLGISNETFNDAVRLEAIWSGVLQAAYDKRVRSERRAEYLRLAAGNEEIARAFWAKAEQTEWPTE